MCSLYGKDAGKTPWKKWNRQLFTQQPALNGECTVGQDLSTFQKLTNLCVHTTTRLDLRMPGYEICQLFKS